MSAPLPDQLRRFDFEGVAVRGAVVHLEASLGEILAQHHYPDAVAGLLGEALAASVLLGSTLKFSGRLSLQCKSAGVVGILFAECSHERRIRGYARVGREPASGDLRALLREGTLAITITPDKGQQYQGIVPLDAPTLAPCLDHYFAQSEQLPTHILLAADGRRAAGFLLQVLPTAASRDAGHDRRWEHLRQLAATLGPAELLSLPVETLLYRLFHADAVRLHPAESVAFGCRCSRERAADTLRSLGEAELRDILASEGEIGIHCEFCQQAYAFDAAAVTALFPPEETGTRH